MTDDHVKAINAVVEEMYLIARDHGFHDRDDSSITTDRMASFCSNLHGEVSEIWESTRKGALDKPCDKPILLTQADEELADIVIRVMDTAQALHIDLGRAIALKSGYNRTRPFMHGKKA
jgi:NTP pyrophosphatase (non-canonical NTP hydrolase)